MTAVFKLDGVELPDGAVLVDSISGLPSAAWYGEPSTAGLVIDDPDGDYDLAGWHTFTVDETDCDKPRIFSGWLRGRRISRGPYRSGPGRIWDVDIVDLNALFSFEVFRANSAQRPAETDVERVEFCIESAAMAGTPCVDNGRFNTAGPLNISAADFVPQFPVELLTSTAGQCGKQFYAYWDHDEEEVSFHYDLVGAGPAATIAISNVEADSDATTFYPYVDAQLTRAPESVYTGTLLKYVGGYVYARNQDTIDALSPSEFSPINFLRDQSLTSDRIGTVATANSYVQTYLDQAAEEQETLVVTVRLPAENVNHVEAGDIIEVTFTHIPGFETVQEMPVIRRSVKPSEGQVDFYDVTLELTRSQEIRPNDGGSPDDLPQQNPCDVPGATLVQSAFDVAPQSPPFHYTATWDSQPGAGNLLIAMFHLTMASDPVTHDLPGWTFVNQASVTATGGTARYVVMFTKIASGSEPMDNIVDLSNANQAAWFVLEEWSGVDTVDVSAIEEDETNTSGCVEVTITPTAGNPCVIVVALGLSQIGGSVDGGTPSGGATLDVSEETPAASGEWAQALSLIVEDPSGAHQIGTCRATGTKGAGVAVALTCSGGSGGVPGVGKQIENEEVATGDGTTVTFNTEFPYAPNSLKVYVDGVQIINGLTQTDPTTGEFTLDFSPAAASGDTRAEVVTASYQVGFP